MMLDTGTDPSAVEYLGLHLKDLSRDPTSNLNLDRYR